MMVTIDIPSYEQSQASFAFLTADNITRVLASDTPFVRQQTAC